jgi:AraC-like DNA-binding protein
LHAQAYATLVLEGSYEEAGEVGRWRVQAGQVLLHEPFSAHCNRAPQRGARLLNLPLPFGPSVSNCGTVADPDRVARLAERNTIAAMESLLADWTGEVPALDDELDRLGRLLSEPAPVRVQDWAEVAGVTRQTVFRGFRSLYGVSPSRYRVEARARRAWRLIVGGGVPLVQAAFDAGYADQAHLCRDLKALTGHTPGAWAERALQHSFKTRARPG